jgi:hypothetical protein
MLQNFYEANINLAPKFNKYTTKTENYKPLSSVNINVNSLKSTHKIQQHIEKIIHHDQVGFNPRMPARENIL